AHSARDFADKRVADIHFAHRLPEAISCAPQVLAKSVELRRQMIRANDGEQASFEKIHVAAPVQVRPGFLAAENPLRELVPAAIFFVLGPDLAAVHQDALSLLPQGEQHDLLSWSRVHTSVSLSRGSRHLRPRAP